MEHRMDYNRLGIFSHRVDVHTVHAIYRFYGITRRRAFKKADRYFQ